jgi:hypothetical protein
MRNAIETYFQTEKEVIYTFKVKDKGVHYTRFAKLPMVDWDWADPCHPADAVTIESMDCVLQLLDRYLQQHRQHVRIYLTPSGVHAFFLARKLAPDKFIWEGLDSDPLYERYCKEMGSFAVRVSAKNRPQDFIGEYYLTLANCEPDLDLVRQLDLHHDSRIARYRHADAESWAAAAVGKLRG